MGLPGRVQDVALLAQVHEMRAQGNDLALLGDGRQVEMGPALLLQEETNQILLVHPHALVPR